MNIMFRVSRRPWITRSGWGSQYDPWQGIMGQNCFETIQECIDAIAAEIKKHSNSSGDSGKYHYNYHVNDPGFYGYEGSVYAVFEVTDVYPDKFICGAKPIQGYFGFTDFIEIDPE